MANDLVVRVLGETSQFEKSLKTATRTTTAFDRTLKKSAITAEQSAQAQIAASVKKDARLREEIALYRQIATAAERGSREQVVAANLAERAERQLGRSMGATSTEARVLAGNTQRFERDLSSATRGALSGSGIFRGLGRSIVFASGGFLAFGGAAAFVRKSIDAARDAQVVERQLAKQFEANGRALEPYRAEIDRTANSLSALSGFTNDELKGALVTILRTQPNVTKALRDTATAADLARARHIGLAQAAFVLAKVEGGNTTLLRRQGIQVAKNAKAEEALAVLRAKVAGQAAAGATEQERFGAILHTTEEIVGTGILPTLNKYLESGGRWLQQMNQSGKLQRDVASGAHSIETAVSDAAGAIHAIDEATGGFKNTLELLLALKVGSVVTDWAGAFGLFGSKAAVATGEAGTLRTALLGLNAVRFGPVIAELAGIAFLFEQIRKDAQVTTTIGNVTRTTSQSVIQNPNGFFRVTRTGLRGPGAFRLKRITEAEAHAITNTSTGAVDSEAAAKAAHGLGLRVGEKLGDSFTSGLSDGVGARLDATQRNRFFDNAIARILLRGGLGDIQKQIAALERADALIAQRIKATKDVTRRLNLEDQLLQNQAQIAQLRAQASQAAAQAAADAVQKRRDSFDQFVANLELRVTESQATVTVNDDIAALKGLQRGLEEEIRQFGRTADLAGRLFDVKQQLAAARAQKISGRQFAVLGFGPTGEQRIPGVQALRKALGNVQDEIIGSSLDTKKTKSLLDSIRKVLSGGLGSVGEEVRAKIQQILGDLDKQLDKSTQKNLTKWRHATTQALLAGVPDLTPQQRRALTARLSALGPGGTVPPSSSAAFTGGRPVVVEHTTYLDGKAIAQSTTKYQHKAERRSPPPRRGRSAGRH